MPPGARPVKQDNITFQVDDAELIYRNFEGREGPFNAKGDQDFTCVLPEDIAQVMLRDGWNVKFREPREEDEEQLGRWTIQVAVGWDFKPPTIVLITSNGRMVLDRESVKSLDNVDIKRVDFIARSYNWSTPRGDSGIKAYLQTMFVTINEDPLMQRYGFALPGVNLEPEPTTHDQGDSFQSRD